MTHRFESFRWITRFRRPLAAALLSSAVACNSTDTLNPERSMPADLPTEELATDGDLAVAVADPAPAAISFAGGIPIGTFDQPTSQFGSYYNGALRIISTNVLLTELSNIRSRGGKVVLLLAGSQFHYKNSDGTFSLSKWKARVDQYRKVNFSSFISDGTIIAHYLIGEPYDPANFGGKPVTGATLEEMARYSKSIWPSLKTVVRAEPYLIKWSGTYRYLDAAWAQYLWRKGNVNDYLQKNVSSAQQMGLGLVVGLNLVHGGSPDRTWMTPDEVASWGLALMNSDYPCAFVSWTYNSDKLNTTAMKDAMLKLRRKAQSKASRSCG